MWVQHIGRVYPYPLFFRPATHVALTLKPFIIKKMRRKQVKDLEIIEVYLEELSSLGYDNVRLGLRIKTTPKTYEEDFAMLTIEIKSKLQKLILEKKEQNKQIKAESKKHSK